MQDIMSSRAVQIIECDYHAHLVSKAGSGIYSKSSIIVDNERDIA